MKTKSRRTPRKAATAKRLTARTRKQLDSALTELQRAELVRPLFDSEPAFLFKHALVQDTALSTLLRGEYKRLNLLVARAYEKIYTNRDLDEYAARLAQHYDAAGDDAKTFEYSVRAGDLAARLFAHQEALALYARALEIANNGAVDTPQRIELVRHYGRTLEVISQFGKALELYQDQNRRAIAAGDRALELAALSLLAILHSVPMGVFDGALALQLHQQALTLARALNDRAAEAQLLWSLTLLSVHQMRPAEAVAHGEASLNLARTLQAEGLDMRERIAFAQHELVLPYTASGQSARALEFNAAARHAWRALDNKPMLVDSIGVAVQLAFLYGQYADALPLTAEAGEISETIGNRFGWIYTQSMRALILIELGEWNAAWTLGKKIFERSRAIDHANHFMVGGFITYLLAQLGACDAAPEIERTARRAMTHSMPEYFRTRVGALFARSQLLCQDTAAAARELQPYSADTLVSSLSVAAPEIWFAHIELASARGESERALELADNACNVFERLGMAGLLAEALYLRGAVLRCLDQADVASAMWQQARALCEQNNRRRLLWQIYAALGELETKRGNFEQAHAYREQARAVLQFIVENTPQEFRAGFLNLPRVRAVMNGTPS